MAGCGPCRLAHASESFDGRLCQCDSGWKLAGRCVRGSGSPLPVELNKAWWSTCRMLMMLSTGVARVLRMPAELANASEDGLRMKHNQKTMKKLSGLLRRWAGGRERGQGGTGLPRGSGGDGGPEEEEEEEEEEDASVASLLLLFSGLLFSVELHWPAHASPELRGMGACMADAPVACVLLRVWFWLWLLLCDEADGDGCGNELELTKAVSLVCSCRAHQVAGSNTTVWKKAGATVSGSSERREGEKGRGVCVCENRREGTKGMKGKGKRVRENKGEKKGVGKEEGKRGKEVGGAGGRAWRRWCLEAVTS